MEMRCPIRAVNIPGLQDAMELSGLIVVIGPNSSGKTQLLHDINEVVMGRKRQLVVASAVSFNVAPDLPKYMHQLIANGVLMETSKDLFQKRRFQYGTDDGGGDFHRRFVDGYFRTYETEGAGKELRQSIPGFEFLGMFGPFSCSALFLKNRLTLMDSCEGFDKRSTAPNKTLQSLHWNREAKDNLQREIATVFKRGIWVDSIGRHKHIVVRVADSVDIPSPEDRLEPELMEKYRGIETEGDGLRSYAAVCATLLMEQRPLCLIDEPEMCLHPPQAYAIGRFIGKHVDPAVCTIVATHSSHVLRGLLECNPNAHVIRLTHTPSRFSGRLLKPAALKDATSKPRSRSEPILEGLFAQAVALCEGEGDRVVYESAYRTLEDRKLDVRFIPSEGTGGFADPLRLYEALGVPTVVIADLDFMAKEKELRSTVLALSNDEAASNDLCKEASKAIRDVKSIAKCPTAAEIRTELEALRETCVKSEEQDAELQEAEDVRRSLTKLAERMSRLREFKLKGLDSLEEVNGVGVRSLRDRIQRLIDAFKESGLFLVPVGELESWLPVIMEGITREDKSKWAMLAAAKIEDSPERNEDVWSFVRAIVEFLLVRLNTSTGDRAAGTEAGGQ